MSRADIDQEKTRSRGFVIFQSLPLPLDGQGTFKGRARRRERRLKLPKPRLFNSFTGAILWHCDGVCVGSQRGEGRLQSEATGVSTYVVGRPGRLTATACSCLIGAIATSIALAHSYLGMRACVDTVTPGRALLQAALPLPSPPRGEGRVLAPGRDAPYCLQAVAVCVITQYMFGLVSRCHDL